MNEALVLHGYWRSSAAYRVRIALNMKGLAFEQVTYDLRQAKQRARDYRVIAPHGLVPTLAAGRNALIQSPAILEWLEERYPTPPLLPVKTDDRAIVRSMAAIIACDIHPLNNLRVLEMLRGAFDADAAAVSRWVEGWIVEGFNALEALVGRHGQGFCFGSTPTIADCMLVPQLYSAERFGIDLTRYPALMTAGAAAGNLSAFVEAHPKNQPDADNS